MDLYLLHQATLFMLDHLRERLSLDRQHTPEALENYGNTVSSTIPILIRDLRQAGQLQPGKQTLLIGFGVGLSWAGLPWTETWSARHVRVAGRVRRGGIRQMPGSSVGRPAGLVRTLQIIVAAMVAGCCAFMAVLLVVVGVPGNPPRTSDVAYVMLAVAAAMVLARVIVPRIVVAQARRKIREGTWTAPKSNLPAAFGDTVWQNSDAGKLAIVLMTQTIVAAAILEGATFLLLVTYLIEHSPLCLGLAVVLLVALAAHFPTVSSCSTWIDEQLRLLDEERAF